MKNKNIKLLNKKLNKKEFEKSKNNSINKAPRKSINKRKDKGSGGVQVSENKNEKEKALMDKENPENMEFVSNPKDLVFLRHIIVDDFYNTYSDIFKSIDNIFYLIYANNNNSEFSIVLYKLIEDIKIVVIKKAHKERITNIKHYIEKLNKRDLIITSSKDNNIKLWNINFECLFNYEKIYDNGFIKSICFLNDNNQTYIVSSNSSHTNLNPIKIFDLNGNLLKELNDSKKNTLFVDNYYDNKDNKLYIITGNEFSIISYEYIENKIYHNYYDSTQDYIEHYNIIINFNENILKLIESAEDGYIRIWNFHSTELINKIKICDDRITCLLLWNNEYIFVGCCDYKIRIRELKNGKKSKILELYTEYLYNLKKINHPQYGECLISLGDSAIKLWGNKIFKNK